MSRRGSNAVEFTIMLPVLLLLASGVIDLGQLLLIAEHAVEATADGAQAGALATDEEDPIALAQAMAAQVFEASSSQGQLSVVAVTSTVNGMDILTVSGTVQFEAFFGMFDLPTTINCSNAIRLSD